MLKELSVQNFALLRELHLELEKGLTVLTGATGAGKSIIVGAIGLLLGDRGGAHVVRQGADMATVEGVFDLSSRIIAMKRLKEMGFQCDEDLLIIKRQISQKGDSKVYLNGSRITMAQLKEIGDMLVDLHGQHDHQSLLRTAQHLDLLDEYGQLGDQRKEVHDGYQGLKDLHQELVTLNETIQERRERRELFEFHLGEIDRLDPQEGEDELLEAEKKVLENLDELFEGLSAVYGVIFEEDNSVIAQLSVARNTLEKLSQADIRLQDKNQELATIIYQLEDMASGLRGHLQSLQPDPERFSQIADRLAELIRLKRKHGGSIAALRQRRDVLARELEALATEDERLEQLRERIREAQETFSRRCQKLSEARKRVAQTLAGEVERKLNRLGMQKTQFSVQIRQEEVQDGWVETPNGQFLADATGMDRVQFLISPNPGEGMRPLAKIASGGEISRIMLAMKAILANADQIPLLVFDEIDVGIGGQVAQAVGQALKSLGQVHQVLCITHLHQIACLADWHYLVHKEQKRGRTETVMKNLTPEEREREIARMMGGKEITPITLEHARELIRQRGESQASC